MIVGDLRTDSVLLHIKLFRVLVVVILFAEGERVGATIGGPSQASGGRWGLPSRKSVVCGLKLSWMWIVRVVESESGNDAGAGFAR